MNQLTETPSLVAAVRDDRVKVEKLRTHRRELEADLAGLAGLVARARLFDDRGIMPLPRTPAFKALQYLAKVRDLVMEDAGKLTQGASYRTRRTRLGECITTLTDIATAAWQTWLADTPRLDPAEPGRVEATAPALVAEVRRLQQVAGTLALPDPEADLALAEGVLRQTCEVVARLQPFLTADPEVRAFLDAVNRGGASLGLLTAAVHEYLNANRLTG